MLDKAVVAVKADKAKTLDTINKGEGGFLDRDLYVFCFNIGDGKAVANGSTNPAARKTIGVDVRTLKDATGKVFGQDLYDAAKEGQITEVSYMFPKPGADMTPVAKISLVTRSAIWAVASVTTNKPGRRARDECAQMQKAILSGRRAPRRSRTRFPWRKQQ